MIVVVGGVTSIISGYIFPSSEWDSSTKAMNPISDVINMLRVSMLTVKIILNTQDQIAFSKYNSTYNISNIETYILGDSFQ
jgi:hypothetical protein